MTRFADYIAWGAGACQIGDYIRPEPSAWNFTRHRREPRVGYHHLRIVDGELARAFGGEPAVTLGWCRDPETRQYTVAFRDHELHARVYFPDSPVGRNAFAMVEAGELSGASVEIRIGKSFRLRNGTRLIASVAMHGLSLTPIPCHRGARLVSVCGTPVDRLFQPRRY